MRARLGLVAISLLLVACSAPAPTAKGTPAPQPVAVTKADGALGLTLNLPKADYAAGEPIDGQATLSMEPGPGMAVTGTDTPITFGFREVGGTRQMGPGSDMPCLRYDLSADNPITAKLSKSGGWSDDDPNADFYRQFFMQPGVALPAGDWDVTAYADVSEGTDCGGKPHQLVATARLHVTDAAAPSPQP